MSNVQCYSCKGFGHITTNCTKQFCNYCKKTGHFIKDCFIWPLKKFETKVVNTVPFRPECPERLVPVKKTK